MRSVPSQEPKSGPVCLKIVVPVWGDTYLDTFLEYSLPAQLSSGNIPVLGSNLQNRYLIYTNEVGRQRCERHTLFALLESHVTVEFRSIDALPNRADGNKYRIKSDCYALELESASKTGAAVAMLNADILLADGFIRQTLRLLEQGKRVIEVTGGRGLQDPIKTELDGEFRLHDRTISISPTDLARIWIANLHPQLAMHHVEGAEGGSLHPSHLYWPVGSEGVIIRAFHLYPIVVKPGPVPIRFFGTIDDDLVAQLAPSAEERFLAQDGTELFCCELSPPEHFVGDVAWRGNQDSVINFYLRYRNENIPNLAKEIIISGKPALGELWEERRRVSREYADHLIGDLQKEIARRSAALQVNPAMEIATPESESGDLLKGVNEKESAGDRSSSLWSRFLASLRAARYRS
ncbi:MULTISPECIES: hypothetical protein [unclassified Bradyrhizobium]|nr:MULTISPECIES: hypothetical protein [unclassified Bradyrhizobium]